MTGAMKRLIEELSQVPKEEQDRVATLLLKEHQGLRGTNVRPLAEMIGTGTGLYESPEEEQENTAGFLP